MKKLWLVTEEINEDGEHHSITWLKDYEENYSRFSRENYKLTSVEATINDVTLDMMIQAVESDMEGADHHREIFLPGWFASILLRHLPEDKVKEIFWGMIQDKGLLWSE